MVAIRIKYGPEGSVKTFQTFPDNSKKIEHSFGKDLSHSAEESKKRGPKELDDVQAKKKQKLECDWSSQCLTLLRSLMGLRVGCIFNKPVDPVELKIPDYFSVITNPMDLGTIRSKLLKNEYGNADEFAGDVRLTFANAMRYNPPGNPVHETAKEIKEVFEVRWGLLKKKKFSKVSGTEVTEGFNMPLLECDWSSQCLTLLSLLMEHRLGWLFNMPVDPVKLKIPDYFSVITNPMDLGTIRSKLLKNEYGNADEFAGDVRLTFANAMRYKPPGNPVHEFAKEIKEVFEVRWGLLKKKKFSKVSGTEVTEGFNMPLLECDWSSQCLTLLSLLMEHRLGWLFNMPVDPVKLKIPDYFSVITNPMDLGTIRSKLLKNEYGNADEFAGDVRLTFANTMRYNPPGNLVHKTAKEIKEVFEVRWELLKKKKFSKVSGTEVTEGFNMPLLECDWSSQCLTLLSLLMEHRLGWLFNMPVDPVKLKIPDYFSVITNPMDLGTIRSKLLKNEYGNADEFAGDVRLTFANTMRYNPPGNLVHKTAKEIKEVFEVRWELLKKKKFSKVSGTEVTEGFKRKSFEDVDQVILRSPLAVHLNTVNKLEDVDQVN